MGTIVIGVVTSIIAFFTSLDILADAISLGTLAAFIVVNSGIVLFRYKTQEHPHRPLILLLIFILLTFISSFLFVYNDIIIAAIFGGLAFIPFICFLFLKQQSQEMKTFKTPLVPFIPMAGIALNLYMMAGLNPAAWYRVIIWIFIGLVLYFGYGIRHSKLRNNVNS